MDYLGAHVAFGLLLGVSILLAARDERTQHLAPQDTKAEEVDGR
jgi:hypothetical protein